MKKAVLREYLKNREGKTITFDRDKFFTFEVEDVNDYKEGAIEKFIKENAKKAVELYEEKVVKPKKKPKKGE